jgi:hypothetical protein
VLLRPAPHIHREAAFSASAIFSTTCIPAQEPIKTMESLMHKKKGISWQHDQKVIASEAQSS